MQPSHDDNPTVQLHLIHPYNIEIRRNAKVRAYLDKGYRIVQLQRLTDREVLVTLSAAGVSAGEG